MTNLLKETLKIMKQEGYLTIDVLWVGSKDGEYTISWNEFEKIADIEYDDGYGLREIVRDLVVVFIEGGWLEREEYDGSERWVYKITPQQNHNGKKFARVKMNEYEVGYDYNLEELNNTFKSNYVDSS